MEIKSVALLGAGAVGSYIIWGLSKLPDISFGIIAEGSRAARLRDEGCTINNVTYHPQVWNPQEAKGVDLLIVALKYGALPGALASIREAVGPNTTVMSLMNGVDSEEIIASAPGRAPYFKATINRSSADIHIRHTDCINEEIWCKFRLNVCNNLPQAVIGAGLGCYRDSEHMRAIKEGLRRELEAIATAKGIDMSKCPASSGRGSAVPPSVRYSTLQDLDAGRHTEIDMFSGALMAMGKELGIPTPYNEYTYHIIKALEEKNDGLFDYSGQNKETTFSN